MNVAPSSSGLGRRPLKAEVRRARARENTLIPPDTDYSSIGGLSREAVEKLSAHRPLSVGEASRLDGVTPADVSVLLIYLGR